LRGRQDLGFIHSTGTSGALGSAGLTKQLWHCVVAATTNPSLYQPTVTKYSCNSIYPYYAVTADHTQCYLSSCPTNFTLSNSACNLNSCPSGFTLVSGACNLTSCPQGFTLVSGVCNLSSCPQGLKFVSGACLAPT